MGNGDGTFKSPVYLADPGSREAYAIVAGDFNNDGNADLAVSNPLDGTVSVYSGNGDGTFQSPKTTTYGTAQSAATGVANIALGAFGGKEGLVVTDPSDHQIDFLSSNLDGTFTVAQRFNNNNQANFNPNAIVAGGLVSNLGGDSIAYSQINSDTIYTATWNGNGFTAGNSYATGAGPINQMITGGFMNTGLPDIAATTAYGYVAILENQNGGNYTLLGSPIGIPFKNPTALAGGFFDGSKSNSIPDIAVMDSNGDIAVASNEGGGNFTGTFDFKPITSGNPVRMVAANLYGGAEQDLVFTETKSNLTSGGGIASLKNGGTPTTPQPIPGPTVTASPLVGTFTGKLPTTVVAGIKTVIKQTLIVKNTGTTTLKGLLSGTLFLTIGQNTANALGVSGAQGKKINLKPGKSVRIPVRITSVPAGTTPGNYFLMMQLTDPNGHLGNTFTSKPISVVAPTIDLTGSFAKVPATAKAGKKTTVTLNVTNNGTVPAKGALPIFIYAEPTPTLPQNRGTATGSKPFRINLKPGKSVRLTLPNLLLPAGSDFLVAQVDPTNLFNDSNTANNTFATSTPITVA